ncbi:MAG: hypothetical protein IKJ63_04340 [Clostridia bacterium]|nr:hypothetical protein [Clostridia bacterium]
MRRFSFLFLVLLQILVFSSCKQQNNETTTTTVPTTVVNNIYITDDGVYADSDVVQQQATTVVVATEPPQTEPTTLVPITQPTEPTEIPLAQYTAQMVLDKIITAVNFAKEQKDFSAHQLQQVEIRLTDCTLSWAVAIINRAIGVFNGPHDFDYTFINGVCADPKEDFQTNTTPFSSIPPSDRLFALEPNGVVAYSAYEENGEYVFSVTLPFEYTDAEILVPYYHAQAMDYLDLGDFDFGIGEITDAICNYPGATVAVHLDQNGNLLKYEETIPMNGSGTGKLGIELSASFEGSMYECWTFDW